MTRTIIAILLLVLTAASAFAVTVSPELPLLLAESGPRPVWIFFGDKGRFETQTPSPSLATQLSQRALARRAKARPAGALVTWADLPNEPDYIAWLQQRDFVIRSESRWLAAVSVILDAADLALLAAAPFDARVEALHPSQRLRPMTAPHAGGGRRPAPGSGYDAEGRHRQHREGLVDPPLDYGGSLTELSQVNVPVLHQMGIHGEGVVIGMMDTGFNTGHEALQGVDVLGAWDFINDDAEVANETGDPASQQNHGTMTLSTVGGYMPGSLIGPAFAASYYLAKTEDTSQEEPIEEDWWVEGIEWLEAQGCDLVSSSLCYDDWYVFDDFDGNTAVTTIAADHAVAMGLVVMNSAGNYRLSTGTIGAPADGDSVIACGAVDEFGEIASFSSPGPTADGRIKPDVCAMGVSNNVVEPGTLDGYLNASGTSFSCPLSAGVAALLLSAYPDAAPMQVRAALRMTASQADNPDNDFGWGILDALAAVGNLQLTASQETPPSAAGSLGAWPNPFNPSTRIAFTLDQAMNVRLSIHDLQGRRLRELLAGRLPAGRRELDWDGRNDAGVNLAGGLYLARLRAGDRESGLKLMLLK